MAQWVGNVLLIATIAFIGYVLCVAVEKKTIGQMIILVAVLLLANRTIVDLKPTIDRLYEAKKTLDEVKEMKDKIGDSPILNWAPGTSALREQQNWAKPVQ